MKTREVSTLPTLVFHLSQGSELVPRLGGYRSLSSLMAASVTPHEFHVWMDSQSHFGEGVNI